MKVLKRFSLVGLIFIMFFSSISPALAAYKEPTPGHLQNKKIEKKLDKQGKKELKKFNKKYTENIKFKQIPRFVEIGESIWVYYDVKNNNTSFFGVEFDKNTNKIKNTVSMVTEQKEDDTVDVIITANNNLTGEFNIRTSDNKFTSGWIVDNNDNKIDIVEYQKAQESKIQIQIDPCLKRCLENAGVPDWVTTLMTTICGIACLGGPIPCGACLAFNAGIYAGKVLNCAQSCPA